MRQITLTVWCGVLLAFAPVKAIVHGALAFAKPLLQQS